MTFDEWIINVFDHAVREPHWEQVPSYWYGPNATIVGYMTRLFAEADTVLASFSDAQAAQGLWAMCSQDDAEYPLLLTAASLPLQARLECLEAMTSLFGRFFARRCTPHLSHLDRIATPAHVSPLNGVCYMWWDVMPLGVHSKAEWPAIQSVILTVFRHCLESNSIACQESALLGLMNWSYDETPQMAAVEEIVERVLSQESGAWPALRKFMFGPRDA